MIRTDGKRTAAHHEGPVKLNARELAAAMHLVEALHHLHGAGNELAQARVALAPVAGCEELWADVQKVQSRIGEMVVALRAASQDPKVTLLASHSGTGCDVCHVAMVGAPESHGERRSGGGT